MKCKECGSEVGSGLKYCNNCGNRVIRFVDVLALFSVLWFVILFAIALFGYATSSWDAINRIPSIWGVIWILDALLTLIVVEFYGKIKKVVDRLFSWS